MSTGPKVIRPERTADFESSVSEVVPIAPTLIETSRGPVEVIDAPGIQTMSMESNGPRGNRLGVMLYSPARGDELEGIGMMHQLDADGARSIAMSLLRLADALDGRKPN